MNLLSVVEVVTTLVTLLLMVAGMVQYIQIRTTIVDMVDPPCLNMYHSRNVKNVPYLFFLISTLNSIFALYYGLLVHNTTLTLINGVGVILWGLYVLVYISVCRSKMWPLTQLLMVGVLLLAHGIYLHLVTPLPPALTNTLGLFLFVWSVILLLTPILDIVDIIHQGSSEGTSLSLLLGGSLCCLSWLVYGHLLNDFYVYAPNILGLGVNAVKTVVIAAFRRPASSNNNKTN